MFQKRISFRAKRYLFSQTEVQYRCSIQCIYTSQTLQCILQVHCNQKRVYLQCNTLGTKHGSLQCIHFTGYPSHGSVRYTACTVYTATTLLLAVDLQYILHPSASILIYFGLGYKQRPILIGKFSYSQPGIPTSFTMEPKRVGK